MTATTQETGFFHPSTKFFRFTLLIFVAALSFGSYFAYDIVAALSPTLVEQLGTSRGTVGALFTSYHVAAIILVLFGGIFTDKIGTRKA
ncbi:MAG: MFS transporter, partial [Candidatus Aminicenantes bacterium]|nr:MFS transporter [Candidatus Aminicenantes bacterium]